MPSKSTPASGWIHKWLVCLERGHERTLWSSETETLGMYADTRALLRALIIRPQGVIGYYS